MKNGTEWTEPGKGHPWHVLWLSIKSARAAFEAQQAVLSGMDRNPDHNTNLRLTGEPLTAEDVQRIAECK